MWKNKNISVVNILLALLLIFVSNIGCSNKKDLNVLDFRQEEINLGTTYKKGVLVFSSNAACHDCFRQINIALYDLDSIPLIALFKNNNHIISMRQEEAGIKDYLQQQYTFFDVKDDKLSLFGQYQINKFPALLFFDHDRVEYLSNKELFVDNKIMQLDNIAKNFFSPNKK